MRYILNALIIWLITNISGTLIMWVYAVTTQKSYQHSYNFDRMVLDGFAFLIIGGIYSLPAIPYNALNLIIVNKMKHFLPVFAYTYVIISVLLFIYLLLSLPMFIHSGRISGINIELISMVWAHMIVAIITTLFFAWKIIEPNSLKGVK